MSFFQNTCKPKGIGGKIMVNMMNIGHSSMAEWGFTHIEIRNNYICLDWVWRWSKCKKAIGKNSIRQSDWY